MEEWRLKVQFSLILSKKHEGEQARKLFQSFKLWNSFTFDKLKFYMFFFQYIVKSGGL